MPEILEKLKKDGGGMQGPERIRVEGKLYIDPKNPK